MNHERKGISTPHFVFQNMTDWVNETNLGLGFADLMCHFEEDKRNNKKASPLVFVEYANENLPANESTSIAEIDDLLKYHHPAYFSTPELKDYVFELDDEGNIDATDVNLVRLVEIRQAYVAAYNEKNENPLDSFGVEDAIARLVPQTNFLYDSNGNEFKISDYLSGTVMIQGKSYTSAILDSGLVVTIASLMTKANYVFLPNRLYPLELLNRWFNGGSPDYLQGRDFRFYLDGKVQFGYPILKKLNFTEPFSRKNVETVMETIRPDYPKLSVEPSARNANLDKLTRLARRYIASYMNKPGTNRKLTALEALNILPGLRGTPLKVYNEGKSFTFFGFQSLFSNYIIPDDKLDNVSLEMFSKGRKIVVKRRLSDINEYFRTLAVVYNAYKLEVRTKMIEESEMSNVTRPLIVRPSRTSSPSRRTIVGNRSAYSDSEEEKED